MIISSLLDTDLYKFTMQQVVWGQFGHATAEYDFKLRNAESIDLCPLAHEIRREINALASLRLTPDEAEYLRRIRFLKPAYIEALQRFSLDPSQVEISTSGGQFALSIRGNWFDTILFEVPILAIINQVYFQHTQPGDDENRRVGMEKLQAKCEQINAVTQTGLPLRIMEFGTRRRYSASWQKTVVETLQTEIGASLWGTSNVWLAQTYDLKPLGTMAHEFLQAGQAFAPVRDSQKFALETWMQEYRGDLGIALSDVFGMDAFLQDFDLLFSKAYDGARHDSGDPFVWGEKLIAHYERLGIDARTKTAVFSDSLDVEKVVALARQFEGRIRTQFGVGTNLTNDLGFAPLQIVLKMVRCNNRPVVKLSDSSGKAMSTNAAYLNYVRQVWGLD